MVVKTDLESILDESGFGAATEMGGFALDKVPEVSLLPEPFCTSILTSSAFSGQLINDPSQILFSLLVP